MNLPLALTKDKTPNIYLFKGKSIIWYVAKLTLLVIANKKKTTKEDR